MEDNIKNAINELNGMVADFIATLEDALCNDPNVSYEHTTIKERVVAVKYLLRLRRKINMQVLAYKKYIGASFNDLLINGKIDLDTYIPYDPIIEKNEEFIKSIEKFKDYYSKVEKENRIHQEERLIEYMKRSNKHETTKDILESIDKDIMEVN